MNGIRLSESLKILISMVVSFLLGISFIADNFVVFLFTALLAILFLITVVALNPALFVCVFFSLSYPVSLTIGKLGINNLGLSSLLIFSMLSMAVLFMRNNFSIDKNRLK
ncbi:MAG TPA: hypothetical protein PLG63_07745, partial [bacterium]|nr:hypothetical protein [bacterium]